MVNNKTSDAQLNATARYDSIHREQKKRQTAKSNAKRFIKNYATEEELQELIDLFNSKHKKV